MIRQVILRNCRKLLSQNQLRSISMTATNLSGAQQSEDVTHFGFETVKTSEKASKVHKVFEEVANSYDIMNDMMSLGIHRVWKDVFMEKLHPTQGTNLIDVAGGTGDIAFRYINYVKKFPKSTSGNKSSVTILDINQNMLDVGMKRAERLDFKSDENLSIDWICGDAEKLPFDDNQFTAYTIAFGIRNVTNVQNALNEAYRVLKPGGRFLCLEFSHIESSETLQKLYDLYSFQVIPPMGQVIASQWEPYQYLVESIRKFPKQKEFEEMIKKAGFRAVEYENLTFGICAIHSGYKL